MNVNAEQPYNVPTFELVVAGRNALFLSSLYETNAQ